jgi:hypothetical protein
MDHDNTSRIDEVYNSYQFGLGLCDCLGIHSLTSNKEGESERN